MNNRNKIVGVGSAVALVLSVLALAIDIEVTSTPLPAAGPVAPSSNNDFAKRFQPRLAVIDGIGSTRNLTPVQLGGPPGTPRTERSVASAERGHHEPVQATH
jgi:hypothetical protein